ncbi:hypothetical protein BOO71_0005395 [Deinococcus marmoris]|uniref:Uncharacterized protein n=1 Tax=Deinococcus marmoris TaxID=249408 RepID=A0A1U7P0B2_9DEIO|nr:hypothetical protein BOO71_0005395 [Deinococcus marmoris]
MLGNVENIVQVGARAIASLAEFAAALVIAAAIVQALWRSLYALFLPRDVGPTTRPSRTCACNWAAGWPLPWNSCWPPTFS